MNRYEKEPDKESGKTGRPEKKDFWFRLRIELSPLQRFNSKDDDIGFHLEEIKKDVSVHAAPRGPLEKAKTVDFDVHGFKSREEAHTAGLRLRKAVILAAAVKTIGIDAGIDQERSKDENHEPRAKGFRVKDEMQGLTVHEGELHGIIVSDAHIVLAPDPREFLDEIVNKYSVDPEVSQRQILALELYGLSQFETSTRARFLVLTSVVEVLAEREPRPEESQNVLQEFIDAVQASDLESGQKSSLLASIDSLRDEAISKACRKLVRRYLGKKAASKFNEIYDIRSKLLHEGDCADGDVGDAEFHLTHMIAAIFEKMIAPSDASSATPKDSTG